ncbi:MAG: ABC transporter substrate-binding protein [Christensenellales bacterium]|jgi:raffinose/stachyose/melibiose transport system substrate-binding protein
MKKVLVWLGILALVLGTVGSAFAAGDVTTIRFYGSDAEYNKNIVAGFEAANPGIKVEIVPVDFTNAEQVIKTGIASGNPVDVSFFWGTQISAFTQSDMALDLTPYLEANESAWKNTFVPALIDGGKVGDKYYAVSYQPVIETIFYNKDLFKEHGIEVPTTWDEYMAACEQFKAAGVYGIGNWSGQNHQLLEFAYQYMANDGTLEVYTAGEADFTQNVGLAKTLEGWKYVYDNGYWYPGEGALTSTKEQTQAAWYQGRIATLFDAGSNAGTYETECDFEVGVMKFPLVQENGKYGLNVVTNALFIPVNAKYPDEAAKFMEYYTSDEGMTHIIASGRLPSTLSMQDKIESPVLKALLETTTGENVVGYKHIQNISSEMNAYVQNDMIGAVCTGTPVEDILQQLEDYRLAAEN